MEHSADPAGALFGNTMSKSAQKNKEVKRYCFTLNNYTEEDIINLKSAFSKLDCKYILGYEVGEAGTPHIQGYINLKVKKSFSSIVKHLNNKRIHIESCKGSEEHNIKYCTKDNNYDSNFIEKPYIEEIDNLYKWEKDIIEIIKTTPDKRTLYYYWEPNGCAGKTTFQKYVFTHFENTIVLSGKASDMKNAIVQYNEINKKLPKTILINIPRESYDYISWSGIEEIKDMFFYSGKYEGGMICGPCPHVIIFANINAPRDKVSNDRWRITRIST